MYCKNCTVISLSLAKLSYEPSKETFIEFCPTNWSASPCKILYNKFWNGPFFSLHTSMVRLLSTVALPFSKYPDPHLARPSSLKPHPRPAAVLFLMKTTHNVSLNNACYCYPRISAYQIVQNGIPLIEKLIQIRKWRPAGAPKRCGTHVHLLNKASSVATSSVHR